MLKPKSSQSSGCSHTHETNRKSLNKRLPESWWLKFSGTKRGADGKIHATSDHSNIIGVLYNTKENCVGPFIKRCGMLASGVMLLHHNACPLLTLEVSRRIWTRSCSTILLTAIISLRATTACLLLRTWRNVWDNRAPALMRSWWKLSNRGWDYWRQTSRRKSNSGRSWNSP
jgi:hypothetical protein